MISQKKITEKIVQILKKLSNAYINQTRVKVLKENIIFKQNRKLSYFTYPSWSSSLINLSEDEHKIFNNFKSSLKMKFTKVKNL